MVVIRGDIGYILLAMATMWFPGALIYSPARLTGVLSESASRLGVGQQVSGTQWPAIWGHVVAGSGWPQSRWGGNKMAAA